MNKVAVFGASGFLGQAVMGKLARCESFDARAIVHSSGNAWALVSAGVPIHFADLEDSESVGAALEGCTHVVNCSRGNPALMTQGLANLLEQSSKAGVQRLIHISSVAIYGSKARMNELREDMPASPDTDYGSLKLSQDEQVLKARHTGLDTVILCPPNIGGAGSPYLDEVYTSLVRNRFALVDGGAQPLELVDVQNLASAVVLALTGPLPQRDRYFVTDCEPVTWADLVRLFEQKFCRTFDVKHVSREQLPPIAEKIDRTGNSLKRAIKHLVSSHVREALRKDPLWERLDKWIRSLVARLPWSLEDKFRLSIEGTLPIPAVDRWSGIDSRLVEQQLRGIRYSCASAARDLGYMPEVSLERSMEAYARWRAPDNIVLKRYANLLVELDR